MTAALNQPGPSDHATDRLAEQVTARIRRLLDTCPRCAERDALRTAAPKLTRRQLEVLRLIADGLTLDQVAGRLHIERCTVGTHRTNITARLGARSGAHAVAIAMRAGLIE
jgi:DNA-binding NarL/FixJ family response regulator